ncbi:hypothetical protein KDW_38730 [Dictyobacter vulcani]|uniref:DUF3592 domain-containing protein n=2 Tax=Dictyobacter vulcani TaxID=2607529 RepID=A0A5J4KTC6_9CHLR|nr:hypothetical protein KDW_38730 [Dictyobacter vulcani]
MGANVLARHYIYASYQPAQCTIKDKQIISEVVDSDMWYKPSLTYNVTRSNGDQETVTGYKGPTSDGWEDRYSTPEIPQNYILQNYTIGQTYPCWYTPFKSPHAVLVLENYSSGMMSFSFWMTLLIGPPLGMVLCMFFSGIKLFFLLSKRGIDTQGKVIDIEQLIIGTKSHTMTTTEFTTQTDPPVSYQTTGNGRFIRPQVGDVVNVVYDPKNPSGNALVGHHRTPMIFALLFSISGFVLLALIMLLMSVLWPL